jgi:hypothetical protein
MSRTALYFLIGILAVVAAVVGYLLYQERQAGVSIKIGEGGVSIDGK